MSRRVDGTLRVEYTPLPKSKRQAWMYAMGIVLDALRTSRHGMEGGADSPPGAR
jgi:hypothetical protein